jgi:TRAP-type C4-dicarboxylate transport system substrate-binding protein
VQRYLTLTRHIYSAWVVLISKKTWDSLSAQEKALMEKAAAETAQFERRAIREASARALSDLEKVGMKIVEPSNAEIARMKQLSRGVAQKYREEFGREAMNLLYSDLTEQEVKRFFAQ